MREGGPSADFDPSTRVARAIADGTSLDVVEMDAASQRGIDDVREIRERAVLQPVEGGYKVYIVDEAHQLTDAAWQALLKLIEEPPPHLVFVFCTTELSKVLATVRSRCQTFVFQRPRLQRARPRAAPRLRRGGDRGARRGAVADRAQRPRLVPRCGLDARPARRGDGGQHLGTGRAPARRRRRGGLAVQPLRRDRRPRHRGRAHARRGARRAGAGPRPARHRPARAPAPPHARAAPGPRARVAAGDRGGRGPPSRAGEPAPARRPSSAWSICSRSPSRTCGRAATPACPSSSRS